ncbi:hypothetical protein [Streptomyces lydicus]|uniref:hypothetical protein n=1 Tax=Streptomyces lydicus TaxID=47763 RepID=UPI0034196A5A
MTEPVTRTCISPVRSLHLTCGLTPHTGADLIASRIRTAFPVLDTPAGQTALLVVAADLLQSAARGDHPELTDPLHSLVKSVAP